MRSCVLIAALLCPAILVSAARAGEHSEIGVGRTSANRLVAYMPFTQPVVIPRSVFPGFPGYATALIGFANVDADVPSDGVYTLSQDSSISARLVDIDPGIILYNGLPPLHVGESMDFGPPFFDYHPLYNIPDPGPDRVNVYAVRFILHDSSGLYSDSEAFTITLIPACPADVDDGSGFGTSDGGVTVDDLLYYLGIFAQGAIAADIDDGSGTGAPDGGVTIDDLLYFLARFAAGC